MTKNRPAHLFRTQKRAEKHFAAPWLTLLCESSEIAFTQKEAQPNFIKIFKQSCDH